MAQGAAGKGLDLPGLWLASKGTHKGTGVGQLDVALAARSAAGGGDGVHVSAGHVLGLDKGVVVDALAWGAVQAV